MPECVVHKWCGGGTSWGKTDMPLNELFVITGCSRADVGTDAPIKSSSCPLHPPSGGAHVLLEKMLNLGIRDVITRHRPGLFTMRAGEGSEWDTGGLGSFKTCAHMEVK